MPRFPEPRPAAVDAGQVRRGAVVILPAEDEITDIAAAGLDFVLVDLVAGPADELHLDRLVRLAHACGLTVLARVEDPAQLTRLARLGVDGAVTTDATVDPASGPTLVDPSAVSVVVDADARPGTPWLALDLAGVRQRSLARLAAGPVDDPVPVVLLPGQLGDVSVWDDVVAALPPGSFRALRIDLDDNVADMAATVLAAAPPRFALAGHSLGGIVALEICRAAPDRVDRLALVNASGRGPSQAQLAAWSALQRRLDTDDFAVVVDDLADANLLPDDPDVDAHRDRWRRMARVVGPDGLRRQLRAQATRPDSLPSLATVRVPTLVVSGSADTVCRPELQAELAAGIPDAEHVVLDGAGHMTPLTAPDALAVLLGGWLRG